MKRALFKENTERGLRKANITPVISSETRSHSMLEGYRISPFGRNDTMKKNRPKRRQEGWTLIEVLVAVVILTVGLLAVGTMQISAIRGNFMGGNTSIALCLASQKMEDLLNRPYDDADLVAGDHGPEQVSDSGETGAGFYRWAWNVTNTTVAPNAWPVMKEIVVTVSWQNNLHSVTLRSMRRQDG
jgi:prepilin-type N-terminal cleavage/methylation domain-containing protein